jgi:hypothetical protein
MRHKVARFLFLALLVWAPAAPAGIREDRAEDLAKERAKLLKEQDPIDRTKIGIKISEILLASVGDAIQAEDFSAMNTHLTEYEAVIEDAHETMVNSGRDARKKANGFKELEIALRKHVLRLDDLGRALSLDHRAPLERAKSLASGIRDGLLKAIF